MKFLSPVQEAWPSSWKNPSILDRSFAFISILLFPRAKTPTPFSFKVS